MDHGPTRLTAGDGTELAAYDAVPVTRRGASLVLLPDIRGMHPYYPDLALCFAQAGIDTVAIDPYARTAGLTDRGADFEYMPHAKALARESVLLDARAAKGRLAQRSDDPVFTLGFCKFGAESWALSATDLSAAGCMGFYGIVRAVTDLVPQMTAPLLVLAAGADQATSPEENAAFDQALTRAAWSMSSSSTPARPTPSSTGPTPTGRTPAPTAGPGCWASSTRTADRFWWTEPELRAVRARTGFRGR